MVKPMKMCDMPMSSRIARLSFATSDRNPAMPEWICLLNVISKCAQPTEVLKRSMALSVSQNEETPAKRRAA